MGDVAAQRVLPGEWEAKLLDHGFEYRGKASASALAKKAQMSPTAVLRVIFRDGSDVETIVRVGTALGDPEWVAEWSGIAWSGGKVDPPAEWHLLDDDERDVIVKAIRLFARGRGDSDARHAEAQKNRDAPLGRRDGIDRYLDGDDLQDGDDGLAIGAGPQA